MQQSRPRAKQGLDAQARVRAVSPLPSPAPQGRIGTAARIMAAAFAACMLSSPTLACDFAPVKKEIDHVLDHDKQKAERFRREVKDGYDSMKVLNDLLPSEWRDKLDECRFFAAEYLAKRGFPPAH